MDPKSPEWVERLLISLAFFFSALLALITGFQNRLNGHPRTEIVLVSLMALGCVLCGLIGLLLFLTGQLSLDAFGVILIGLLPALEATGKIRIGVLSARAKMRQQPALHNRLSDLMYLRHGKPPTRGSFGDEAYAPTGKRMAYLRQPASSKTISDHYPEPEYSYWHGQVLEHNNKYVSLRDLNDAGDAARWWKAANDAIEVVRDPSKMRLHKRKHAIRALELVAEIAMIGDSVFEYLKEPLKQFAKNSNGLQKALSATPASVCTAFLDAVGLSAEWGPVNEDLRNKFVSQFDGLARAKRYGMLFFILLKESELFQEVTEKAQMGPLANAKNVIASFLESDDESTRKAALEQWLSRYRLDRERLDSCREVRNSSTSDDSSPPPLYAMIPLPDDVNVPEETADVVIDFNKVPSDAQRHNNTASISITAGSGPVAPHVPGSVPPHAQDIFSGPIRFLAPFPRTGAGRSTDAANSGTRSIPAATPGNILSYDAASSPVPPARSSAGAEQTTDAARAGGNRDDVGRSGNREGPATGTMSATGSGDQVGRTRGENDAEGSAGGGNGMGGNDAGQGHDPSPGATGRAGSEQGSGQ